MMIPSTSASRLTNILIVAVACAALALFGAQRETLASPADQPGLATASTASAPTTDWTARAPIFLAQSDGLLDEESLELLDEDEAPAADTDDSVLEAAAEHEALFQETRYPSAATCLTCHPKQYREWSVSSHAYSQLSPIYLALNNKINVLANGSNGDFCLRCHNQVGANLGESSIVSNLERHPTSREGITCVVCHRIDKDYNKASGRIALVEGGLLEPIYGPTGNDELARVLENRDQYRVVTKEGEPGRQIHTEVKQFASISQPVFCGACHDVTLFNGFRLEEAFSEYRVAPASARGETCQDCHMGQEQGVASGYGFGPAAVVGGVETMPRKLTNHFFAGPDYSVIHPGIFPHNSDAQQMATIAQWLDFDDVAGWGTDDFEDTVSDDFEFPERWLSVDDRYDAREILEDQFELLEWARQQRLEVLRNGYHLSDIVTERADSGGARFRAAIRSVTDGHNVPTGFTGERVVWLEVTVTGADGNVVYKTGDRDPNGDLRDSHSSFVVSGSIELDRDLMSLQSIFVVQNGRGAELDQVIPIPYPSISLPRVLPSPASLVFTGEPPTERNHKKAIEPLGIRWGTYRVDGGALTGKGSYRVTVKLNTQMVPVNLLIDIQDVGFDYNMSARDVADALVGGTETLWEREVTFEVTD